MPRSTSRLRPLLLLVLVLLVLAALPAALAVVAINGFHHGADPYASIPVFGPPLAGVLGLAAAGIAVVVAVALVSLVVVAAALAVVASRRLVRESPSDASDGGGQDTGS